MAEAAGWFCYHRWNGLIMRSKSSTTLVDGVHADTKRMNEQTRLCKFPLSQQEWDHATLDELQAKYPLPAKFREIG